MNKEYRKKLFDILDKIEDLKELPDGFKENMSVSGNKENTETNEQIPKVVVVNHDHRKRYSREFKKMIVKLHRDECRTYESITKEYGVSKASITKWCSDVRYENKAKLDETTRELLNIRNDYEKVKEENAFLKKIVILTFGKEMEVRQ